MTNLGLEFEKPLIELEKRIEDLKEFGLKKGIDLSDEIAILQRKADTLRKEIFENLTPWQRIMIARHPKRPTALEYINLIFDEFIEFHAFELSSCLLSQYIIYSASSSILHDAPYSCIKQ
jgi:acetyl-CoA carboxylase carboxyl transferase subunit alpha